MSFFGTSHNSLDAKGRVSIPVRYREALGPSFIVTIGFDKCLCVYSFSQWHKIEKQIRRLSSTKKDMRDFSRYLFGGATEVEPDKQGRILLPANLRAYAELEKDVTILGVNNRIEIWDRAKWDERNAKAAERFNEIGETLIDFDVDFDDEDED
jgi:MraZ protein